MTAPVCDDALALIKRFEGLRTAPYVDAVGVPTIGYGATKGLDGAPVTLSHRSITQQEAETLLLRDVQRAARGVDRLVRVTVDQDQRGALASFSYNLGVGTLQASTLLRRVNAYDWEDVPRQFGRWVYGAGRILPGLVCRRMAEATLWQRWLEHFPLPRNRTSQLPRRDQSERKMR